MMPFRHTGSIRLRLAILLTGMFVLLGATLLGVSYALVRANLNTDPHRLFEAAAEQLGVLLQPGGGGGGVEPRELHQALREAVRRGGDLPRSVLETAPHERREILEEVRGVQEELADDALRELTVQYLVILAAMALLSAALGWYASGRVLRPVSEITATAQRVSKQSLHERIGLEGPDDELKGLADTFDEMLARLEEAFERQDAFVRNASHELRTPLAVIRTETDVALADEAEDPEAMQRALARVREAGRRSERLVDALLALAQADRADRPRVELDMADLVADLADAAAFDGLEVDRELDPAPVTGDRELLRTMVGNLIDNAIRHNTPKGWIRIGAGRAGPVSRIEIENSGATIGTDEAAALAEPFRQVGSARSGEGLGLGLSIAAAVAEAHDGRLSLAALDGGGLRVEVELPAA
jgi:signal transduction histidine kinase